MQHAYEMAVDALGLVITGKKADGEELPKATQVNELVIEDGIAVIIEFDMLAYQKKHNANSSAELKAIMLELQEKLSSIEHSEERIETLEEELKKAMERAGFSEILIREDETAFSFPTAQKLFDHFKNVGYVRYVQRLPEEYKEAFLQKILQDIEEDYTKNKTQRCRRWFVYGRKKEGTATL